MTSFGKTYTLACLKSKTRSFHEFQSRLKNRLRTRKGPPWTCTKHWE